MDASTAVVLAAAISGVLGFGGATMTGRIAGRASKMNAQMEWVKVLQASEAAARKEAVESRERADRIRDEADEDVNRLRAQYDDLADKLRSAHALADKLTDTLTSVQQEIWRPEPNIQALRNLVGRPSGLNGR